MTLLCCFKDKSVRTSTIPPLSRNKENNRLPNNSALGVSANNNFSEHAAVLHSIQKNTDNSENKRYFSNEQHFTSQQYALLHYSYLANGHTLNLLRRFAFREQTNPEKLKHLDSRLKEAVDIKKQFVTGYLKEIKYNNKPLLAENYAVIEVTKNLLNDVQKIKKLVYQAESRYFLNDAQFCPQEMLEFNHDCQKLLAGTLNDEPRVFLRALCRPYAASGVVRRQLPTVKQEFEKIKKAGTVDSDFLELIEQTIHNVEVGLRNVDHPKRQAILETIAPKARPVNSWEIAKVLGTNHLILAKSDSEIENILKALKAIPLELV